MITVSELWVLKRWTPHERTDRFSESSQERWPIKRKDLSVIMNDAQTRASFIPAIIQATLADRNVAVWYTLIFLAPWPTTVLDRRPRLSHQIVVATTPNSVPPSVDATRDIQPSLPKPVILLRIHRTSLQRVIRWKHADKIMNQPSLGGRITRYTPTVRLSRSKWPLLTENGKPYNVHTHRRGCPHQR